MSLKILTVVGARPQFVKAAVVSRAIASQRSLQELLVHTGQHHDAAMSQVFFDELGLPAPHENLGVAGGSHGEQTGRMLGALESVMQRDKPDWVLIYGDTNSTLAGALAAAKLNIPVAHVEAGLRSWNRAMPEEVNRVVADHLSAHLFPPTDVATANLLREGKRPDEMSQVGDVMYDATLAFTEVAARKGDALAAMGLSRKGYILATVHRQENVDDPVRLGAILEALATLSADMPVVLPIHPRARKELASRKDLASRAGNVRIVDPVGYLEMLLLEQGARLIMTDSGGVQKEAFFHGVPCVTLRTETEWTELVDAGWNTLASPSDSKAIVAAGRAALSADASRPRPLLYGKGDASDRIAAFFTR
jgi:UDP-GlcNAc3NAcA epimerase